MEAMAPTGELLGAKYASSIRMNLPCRKECRNCSEHHQAGGMRELHWHPMHLSAVLHGGEGCNDRVYAVGSARTMDFYANDVGFVPANAGHYVENTGDMTWCFWIDVQGERSSGSFLSPLDPAASSRNGFVAFEA